MSRPLPPSALKRWYFLPRIRLIFQSILILLVIFPSLLHAVGFRDQETERIELGSYSISEPISESWLIRPNEGMGQVQLVRAPKKLPWYAILSDPLMRPDMNSENFKHGQKRILIAENILLDWPQGSPPSEQNVAKDYLQDEKRQLLEGAQNGQYQVGKIQIGIEESKKKTLYFMHYPTYRQVRYPTADGQQLLVDSSGEALLFLWFPPEFKSDGRFYLFHIQEMRPESDWPKSREGKTLRPSDLRMDVDPIFEMIQTIKIGDKFAISKNTLLLRGLSQWEKGDRRSSKEYLERYLEYFPDAPRALTALETNFQTEEDTTLAPGSQRTDISSSSSSATRVDSAAVLEALNASRQHLDAGISGDAIAALQEVIDFDPSNLEARYELAKKQMESQDWGAAMDQVVELMLLGSWYRDTFEVGSELSKDKKKFFKNMVKDTPSDQTTLTRYAFALSFDRKWDDALEEIDRAIESKPHVGRYHGVKANFLSRMRQSSSALNVCRECILVDPNEWICHLFAGWSLIDLGRHVEAIEDLETARNLRPGALSVNVKLAEAYLRTENFLPAIQHLEQALRCDPSDAGVHVRLASAYAQIRETEKARYHAQLARELGSPHASAVIQLIEEIENSSQ